MKYTIELTEAEDSILTPYAASQKQTAVELVVSVGKMQALQAALRSYADEASRSGSVDGAILAVLAKDVGAVFNAVWTDWSDKKTFLPLVSSVLQARAPKSLEAPK